MRTIAKLSRITGIDYNTVKYYAKPATDEAKGAGLLAYTERRGGKNYYDDKALIDLTLIGIMRKCGSSHAEIRRALDSYELEDAFENQEKVLKQKIAELNRSLRTANLMRRFIQACDDGDEDQIGMILGECVYLSLEYAAESIAGLEAASKLSYEDGKAQSVYERMVKLQSRIKSVELRVARGLATEDDLREELDKMNATVLSDYSKLGFSLKEMPKSIMELWEEGAAPTDASVQTYIDWMYRLLSLGITGFTPKLFYEICGKLIRGNEIAVLMELVLGEGFTDFQQQALDVYVDAKEEKK